MNEDEASAFQKISKELKFRDVSNVTRMLPLTLDILQSITNMWGANPLYDDILTALYLGHDALLRSVELLSLQVMDLLWSFTNQQVTVVITRSKAKRSGAAEQLVMYNRKGPCAYSLLLRHLTKHRIMNKPAAFIFTSDPNRLTAGKRTWLTNAIKYLVRSVGLQPDFYSTHSLRAGGATDLLRANVPLEVIKKAGRWRSDEVLKYLRDETFVAQSCKDAFSRLIQEGQTNGGVHHPSSHLQPRCAQQKN
jgi:hypothetical protein